MLVTLKRPPAQSGWPLHSFSHSSRLHSRLTVKMRLGKFSSSSAIDKGACARVPVLVLPLLGLFGLCVVEHTRYVSLSAWHLFFYQRSCTTFDPHLRIWNWEFSGCGAKELGVFWDAGHAGCGGCVDFFFGCLSRGFIEFPSPGPRF